MHWICLGLLLMSSIFAEQEMDIALQTASELEPIYVAKMEKSTTLLSNSYLDKLEEVLLFDLKNNGYFFLLSRDEKESDLVAKKKTFYVIHTKVEGKTFHLQIDFLQKKQAKKFSDIPLTGELSIDRRRIHQVSDAVLDSIFQKKGVATTKVLYTVRTNAKKEMKKWNSEIWISDYDGGNPVALTRENNYCVHPIFLPRRKESLEFIYVSYKTGQPKLYRSALHAREAEPYLDLRGNQLIPSFSPKGDKLAFISDAAGRPDLFVQRLDYSGNCIGRPLQIFSFPRATEASPTFSPDGEKIAFLSDKDGSPRIYLMKVPQEELKKTPYLQLITKRNKINVTPAWSPDGKLLAYSAKTDGEYQIWIYDFDKDEEWQLTKGPMNKENPSWAPDSLHIVYNTEDHSSSELYLINIRQKESVKIPIKEGQKRFACWEPKLK